MRRIHCEGCGMTEPVEMPHHKILPVVLGVVEDPRFPSGTVKYEADLCPTCRGTVLYTYFGIKAEGSLDIPAFIEPVHQIKKGEKVFNDLDYQYQRSR